MIRPPSNIKPRDDFYSRDPAFQQPAPDATAEQLEAHANRIRVARETGDWSQLLVEGGQPTKFLMRPLKSLQFRMLADRAISGRIGRGEMNNLAFRAALVELVNAGELEVKTEPHDWLGIVASAAIADALDALDPRIVTELGEEVLRRAQDISPKSSRD